MLTVKEKKSKEYMEKQLAVPPAKFILKYGILFWGVPFVILLTLFEYLFLGKSLLQQWDNEDLIVRILLLPLGGALYGYLLRKGLKKHLAKLHAKEAREKM
jgi:hypothetical protein